jgi:hypothetical protein
MFRAILKEQKMAEICIKLHNKKINILLFLSNKARWLKWLGHKNFFPRRK